MKLGRHFSSLLMCAAVLFLVSCAKPFQPPLATFKLWQKASVSEDEIKKAMLECGYATPFGAGDAASNNEVALMQLCMERSGFVYDKRIGTMCAHYPRLDACQARNQAAVPFRDTERRLNGLYCKNKNYSHFSTCK